RRARANTLRDAVARVGRSLGSLDSDVGPWESPVIRDIRGLHLASPMHRITQVEHPVALDDQLWILEHQVAVSERPEVRLPPAEDDWHDVDRHVVDKPQRQRLPADLTR